jgi:hypothetical protein
MSVRRRSDLSLAIFFFGRDSESYFCSIQYTVTRNAMAEHQESTISELTPTEEEPPTLQEEVVEEIQVVDEEAPEEEEDPAEPTDSSNELHSTNHNDQQFLDDQIIPTAVTVDRKEHLLRKARADRLAWIQSVPLPYSTAESNILDATHIIKELPTVGKILSNLYGNDSLSSRLEELIPRSGRDEALCKAEEVLDDERRAADADLRGILSDYQAFLAQLERPESAVIVNGMRHSLRQMGKLPATSLRNQVASTLEQLKRIDRDEAWTKRSLESFLYGQAQESIMSTLTEEQKRDEELYEKLQTLNFVTAKHLDLNCFLDDNKDLLATAVSTLLSIQNYYSPYEKLQRILKAYHCVNEALTKAQNGKLPSADDVLPTLIWTVLQAKPWHLVSNLVMIETHGPPEYLRGEAGYAYTNLYGAVQFLVDLELNKKENEPITSLTITPQEFRQGLEKSRSAMEAQLENSNKQKELVAKDVKPPKPVVIPVVEVRAARLRGDVVDLEWARKRFMSAESTTTTTRTGEATSEEQVLPTGFSRNYSFLTSQPDEIRMADLPLLLQEYQMLVRTTETLLAERSQRASQERKERLLKAEKAIQESANEAELGFLGSGRRK